MANIVQLLFFTFDKNNLKILIQYTVTHKTVRVNDLRGLSNTFWCSLNRSAEAILATNCCPIQNDAIGPYCL